MVRIGYFGYRGWSFQLLDRLLKDLNTRTTALALIGTVAYRDEPIDYRRYQNLRVCNPKDPAELEGLVRMHDLTLALFYGWSWIVPASLTTSMDCLCLHPSLLPKYRGGTPFQHQIINGETDGGLTIFKMTEVLDGGPILQQRTLSLRGSLGDIFQRVVEHGAEATLTIIRQHEAGRVTMRPQEHLEYFPPYRRRTPHQSELKFTQLSAMSARAFYNFVRALDDPFPNCFLRLTPTEKLLLKEVRLTDRPPPASVLFDGTPATVGRATVIRLRDGYAHLVRYAVVPRAPDAVRAASPHATRDAAFETAAP